VVGDVSKYYKIFNYVVTILFQVVTNSYILSLKIIDLVILFLDSSFIKEHNLDIVLD